MRSIIAFALTIAATPALAQPATRPGQCTVVIARAPDDARAAVEKWLSAEPRCSVALEIWIVPTERGLYLLARDQRGRVRERIVPDAQAAGVLVTSWAADDTIPAPEMSIDLSWSTTPRPAPQMSIDLSWSPTPRPAPALDVELSWIRPPSPKASVDAKWSPSRKVRTGQTFGLGGMMLLSDDHRESGQGLRGELDVMPIGPLQLGGALSMSHSAVNMYRSMDTGYIDTLDIKAMAYLAHTHELGGWQLRSSLGGGVVFTYLSGTLYSKIDQYAYAWPRAFGTYPVADASIVLGHQLTHDWNFNVGPMVTWFAQRFAVEQPAGGMLPPRGLELVLFVGARRQL
jgi:hypothetical protein